LQQHWFAATLVCPIKIFIKKNSNLLSLWPVKTSIERSEYRHSSFHDYSRVIDSAMMHAMQFNINEVYV
jgi:hypothetical protein